MAMAKSVLSLLAHLHAALLFVPADPAAGAAMYNVLRYGARPDGAVDAAGAFLRAWADACRSTRPAAVYVPPGRYLVSSATFSGPCHAHAAVTFAVAGTIVAPAGAGGRGSSGRWITFESMEGLVVSGGTFDGRGRALWACRARGGNCPTPTSVRSPPPCRNTRNLEVMCSLSDRRSTANSGSPWLLACMGGRCSR
jgi:polygalacturonase